MRLSLCTIALAVATAFHGQSRDTPRFRGGVDQTGGRTETVRGAGGLDAAIARIAEELRRQYSLGYATSVPRDGQLHELRVDVRDRRMNVRARRGFIAS